MNILKRLKKMYRSIISPRPILTLTDHLQKIDKTLQHMQEIQQSQSETLITLARISFIKPETLYRESKNTKANAEYLVTLAEHVKKEKS